MVGALAMYCLMLEMISREIVPYEAPFAASLAAFLCLILDHWSEWRRAKSRQLSVKYVRLEVRSNCCGGREYTDVPCSNPRHRCGTC